MELKAIELFDSYEDAAKRARYYAAEHNQISGTAAYGDRWSVLVADEIYETVMLRFIDYANRLNQTYDISLEATSPRI